MASHSTTIGQNLSELPAVQPTPRTSRSALCLFTLRFSPIALIKRGARAASCVVLVFVGILLLGTSLIGSSLFNLLSDDDEGNTARTLANNAPYFFPNLPLYMWATTDVAFDMAIGVADANNDTVNVTWEWGDGTPSAQNTTPPALTAVMVYQTHTWSISREPGLGDYYAGPFQVNITLDDGMGGVTRTQRYVNVYVPPNGIPEMSLSAPLNVDPSDPAFIVANATDPEGDPLTWTFVFNNSLTDFHTEVYHTPSSAPNETVWNNITFVFGVEGSYIVKLNVSDALPPNQVWPHNISFSVAIQVVTNHAPQVVGVIETDPDSLTVNATIGYLLVNYSVEAFDPDGDVLYAYWDFGDGTPIATNVSAGGTQVVRFVQQRNYTDVGAYNITVIVGDGRAGHNVSLNLSVQVASTNLPPSVVRLAFHYFQHRSYALPNELIYFELLFGDPESDAIEVVVSFGDNSSMEYYNLTEFSGGNASLSMSHAYALPGEYTITIWYSDNKVGVFEHSKYINVIVTVKETPPVIHKYWDAWDYISLALFVSAIVLPIAWIVIGLLRRED